MKKTLISLLVALVALANAGATGKVYTVIMGATQDAKIGTSCKIDLDHFENEVATLTMNLDLDRMPTVRLDGNQCDRPNMERALNQLASWSRDDIVFFYYTGHGGRSYNDKTQWPQMCMNYMDERNFVPLHEVITRVSSLPAHLKLILTDCCNSKADWISSKFIKVQSRGATDVSEIDTEKLAKLFVQQNGVIVATGSEVGQTSQCNDVVGGFFTVSFWQAIEDVGMGVVEPSWAKVFKRVVDITHEFDSGQTPIYQLPTEAPTATVVTNTTPVQPSVVGNSTVNGNMLTAMSQLLNRNVEIGQRLRSIDSIVSTYFANSAVKVQTVGRDTRTIVDTEDVGVFLRRLCFDKKIRQINVIAQNVDGNNHCTYLKVHEVRDITQ